MMEFSIHCSGETAPQKFRVPAEPAMLAGTWSTVDSDLLRPVKTAVRARLPYRWRKAFDRASGFWFDKESRFDGERFSGKTPHMTLHDRRGRYLTTVYALPCSAEERRP